MRAAALRADDAPLFEQEPYDTIKLDDENKNALLKVFPLDLPDRKVPEKPKPDDELEIRLVDRPRKSYKVQWAYIVEVKLFEQMVLEEAELLTANGKFDDAYPYYEFLQRRHGQMPGLEAAYQKYLFQNAGAAYKQGRLDECSACSGSFSHATPTTRDSPRGSTAWPISLSRGASRATTIRQPAASCRRSPRS